MDFVIAGGNVLMPGGAVERVDLTISAGNIVAVGESGSATSRRWRADGLMVKLCAILPFCGLAQ